MDRLEEYTNILFNKEHKEYYKANSKTIAIATLPIATFYNDSMVENYIKEQMNFLNYDNSNTISFDKKLNAIKNNVKSDLGLMGLSYGIKNSVIPIIKNSSEFSLNILKGIDLINIYTNHKIKYLNATNPNSYSNFKNKILLYVNKLLPLPLSQVERSVIINKNSNYIYDQIKFKNKIEYFEPAKMFALGSVNLSSFYTKELLDDLILLYAKKHYNAINNPCKNPYLYSSEEILHYYSNVNNIKNTDPETVRKQTEQALSTINDYISQYSNGLSYGNLTGSIPLGNNFYKSIIKEILLNNLVDEKFKNIDHLKDNIYNYLLVSGKPKVKETCCSLVDSTLQEINTNKNITKLNII